MQTFESGGALMVHPGVPLIDFAILAGIGLGILTIPPLVGVYLLLFT